MRGEGSVSSPFVVEDSEDESQVSRPSSDSSYPRSPRLSSGQRAKRRDGRAMFIREKRRAAKRVSSPGRDLPQSPVIPTPPSPAPRSLVLYGDRLVPVELESDLVPQGPVSKAETNPLFVEGSSRSGVGWRAPIVSGVGSEAHFEAMARSWTEYEQGDIQASLENYGDSLDPW